MSAPPAVLARLAAEHSVPAITAEVVRVEIVEGKDTHAKFVIKVSSASDGYNSFHVRRRYSQFDTLHASLRSVYRGLPSLPGKSGMLSGLSGDEASKAEGRREGLTSYLRTLLADPVINKCDELVSFLEISSASELFAKLHEKDTQFMLNLAAKDEEIEKMRINLQAASAERSTARAALVARQEDLDESKGRMEALAGRLQQSEDACRRAESSLAEAQRSLSEAKAASEAAEARATKLSTDLAAAESRAAEATAAASAAQVQAAAQVAAQAAQTLRATEEREAAAAKAAAEVAEARSEVAKAKAEAEEAARRCAAATNEANAATAKAQAAADEVALAEGRASELQSSLLL